MATEGRVKLYCFNESLKWNDLGTGRINLMYLERLQGLAIIIRSEADGSLLLESKVTQDKNYQKQEETLIVWTEEIQESNGDLAISFQDMKECDDIWLKLCEYQGKDPIDCSQEFSEDGEISEQLGTSTIVHSTKKMKAISLLVLLVVALLAKQSTLGAPTPAPTQGAPLKTTLITIIAKAEIQATYLAENAFAIADARVVNQTENVTYSCFIEPRDLHPSNPPPLQRLASDREWLAQFLNYTKSVYEADCPTFPPTDRTCFNINYTITNIMNLKALLDKIIPTNKTEGAAGEAMGSGEETETPSATVSYCNSTSHSQQHWSFSTLGTLADLFIKEDLKALADTITIQN